MTEEDPARRSDPPSLWQNRDYLILWAGQIVSSLGSGISQITVPLLVLSFTHSPAQAGIVAGVQTLPYPVLGLLAGALVDRWDRKQVMIVSNATLAVATGSVGAALLLGRLTMAQLYIVALVSGTVFVFYSLAETAAIPSVVHKEHLPVAFAQNQSVGYVTGLMGPPIGGLLFQVARAVPFLADAVSYLGCLLSLLFVRRRFQGERTRLSDNLREDIREGLVWLWGHKLLRTLAFVVAGVNLLSGSTELVIIVLARQEHAPAAVIGSIFAIASVGGILGSVVGPAIQRRFRFVTALGGSFLVEALIWPLFLVAPNAVALGLITGVTFIMPPVVNVVGVSYRAAVIPDALQGRVLGAYRVMVWGVLPLGAALGGVMLQQFGPRPTVWVIAVGLALLGVCTFVSRSIRQAPPLSSVHAE